MAEEKKVPIYTKAGWGICWITMLIIFSMIVRNCAGSLFYGPKTDSPTVMKYYELGMSDAKNNTPASMSDSVFDNPVIRKSYSKGYREGLDSKRTGEGVLK